MNIGKTIGIAVAVALGVGIAFHILRRARSVQASKAKAGFSADATGGNTGVVGPKLSIDVDTGEPVLSTR